MLLSDRARARSLRGGFSFVVATLIDHSGSKGMGGWEQYCFYSNELNRKNYREHDLSCRFFVVGVFVLSFGTF